MRILGIKPSYISDPKPPKVLWKIVMRFLKIPKQVEVENDGVINVWINKFYLFQHGQFWRSQNARNQTKSSVKLGHKIIQNENRNRFKCQMDIFLYDTT